MCVSITNAMKIDRPDAPRPTSCSGISWPNSGLMFDWAPFSSSVDGMVPPCDGAMTAMTTAR